MPYTLYIRPNSGSFAIQVLLEEIGLPYQKLWIGTDSAAMDRLRHETAIGKIPVLMLPDGTYMFETAAVLIHLVLAHPEAGLFAKIGTSEFAILLQWMEFLSADVLEAALHVYYADHYSTDGESDADSVCRQARAQYVASLAMVSPSLNPYLLGRKYTVADIYLYMLAAWWPGDRAQFNASLPKIGAHSALVASRAAILTAAADHPLMMRESVTP